MTNNDELMKGQGSTTIEVKKMILIVRQRIRNGHLPTPQVRVTGFGVRDPVIRCVSGDYSQVLKPPSSAA